MSVAFYHDDDQHQAILETKSVEEAQKGETIVTEIFPG